MEEILRENDIEFSDQVAERKLKLVDDDIVAAKKQIASLENQKLQLSREIHELSEANERLTSHESGIHEGEKREAVEATFFTLLAQLEAEQASLQGELQSYKDVQRNLGHQISKYTQINKKLAGRAEIEERRCQEDQEEIREINDQLLDLNEQLDKKKLRLDELQKECMALKKETEHLTEQLKSHKENVLGQLLEEEKEKKKQLADLVHNEKLMREEVARKRRDYEASVAESNAKIVKQQSISSWLHDRTVLVGKLKRMRQQLQHAKRSLEDCNKKKDVLARKFTRLLQDDDPTGNGVMARKMVQAEIEAIEKNQGLSKLSNEVDVAYDYREELTQKLEQLNKSVAVFKAHRKQTLDELNEELVQCSQYSYLNLLQSELNALQSTVSRY